MKYLVRAGMGAAFAAILVPSVASAQLVATTPSCDSWIDVQAAYGSFNPTPTGCLGAFEGNDKKFKSEIEALLASTWNLQNVNYFGSGDPGESSALFSSVGDGSQGSITLNSPLSGDWALVLRAANQFSVYYFTDLDNVTTFLYSMAGVDTNDRGMPKGLSGVSLYSIPEPGLLFLLGSGLAGLGVVGLRRRSLQA